MTVPAGTVPVVGSINQDHVVTAEAFPAPGETVHGTGTRTSVGGKGANQAVAAARAGAAVTIVGRIGADAAGRRAIDTLRMHGVGTSLVRESAEAPTGSAWITVAEGDNTIVVVAGANAEWDAGWPAGDSGAREALRSAAVLLCQLEIPLTVVRAAADAAAGLFVLNPSPAATLPDSLLAACDVLVVNEHELAIVSGTDPDVGAAHARLLDRGVRAVVTTLGAAGAVVTDGGGTVEVASPAAEVVDTTGAGDAFAGVLCARLAAGGSLPEAVRWAVMAGSLAVRSAGTIESYPDHATLAAGVA